MTEGELFRKLVQTREAWQIWCSTDVTGNKKEADELHERYLELAEQVVPEIHPLVVLAAEAALIHFSAEDDHGNFIRFGGHTADDAGAAVVIRGDVLYEASPNPPDLVKITGEAVSLADLVGSRVVSAVERLKRFLERSKNLTAQQNRALRELIALLEVKVDTPERS